MRPLVLKMKNFGSYYGEHTINLKEFGDKGIYLITGDTGSGKTTIFDAIAFALYGKTSNNAKRNGKSLRSDIEGESGDTYVELTFLANGEEYTIKREPGKDHVKRNGEIEKRSATCLLTLPGRDKPEKAISEVERLISEEIIKLDHLHFMQIAMIAQGDFEKLLTAETKERIDLFRKLFRTEKYLKLQQAIEDEAGRRRALVQELERSLEQYVAGIAYNGDDESVAERVALAKSGSMNGGDIADLADELVAAGSALLKQKEEQLELADIRLTQANEQLKKEKERTELFSRREKMLAQRNMLEKQKAETADELAEKKRREPEITSMTEQIGRLGEHMKQYERLDSFNAELDKLKEDTEKKTKLYRGIGEKTAKAIKRREGLEAERADLENAQAELNVLSGRRTLLTEKLSELSLLREQAEKCSRDGRQLRKLQADTASALKQYSEAQAESAKLFTAFMEGQAGILAGTLEDGKPCPVCGSTSHPSPARAAGELPDRAAVDAAAERADKLKQFAERLSAETQRLSGECDEALRSLKSRADKLISPLPADAEEIAEAVRGEHERRKNELSELDISIAAENGRVQRRAEIETEILPKADDYIRAESEKLAKLKSDIEGDSVRIQLLEKQAAEIRGGLEFPDSRAAMVHIDQLKKQCGDIAEGISSAAERLEKAESGLSALGGQLKQIEEQLAGYPQIDAEALAAEAESLSKQKQSLHEGCMQIGGYIDTHKSAAENIRRTTAELKTAAEEYETARELDEIANGRSSIGGGKLKLEPYVQAAHFEKIIDLSNDRLMIMTQNGYALKRTDEAKNASAQSGLELSIVNLNNMNERSVRTLSGGESFLCSLALALGFSDEIQRSSGGIKLDSMYIDEGFGTLDNKNLQQVMDALATLAEGNRLVGLISHIEELQNRLTNNQLIVTKDPYGSSRVEIITT